MGLMKSKKLKRKLAFYQSFPSLIEIENSNLGKLLLQENLIFNEIISTLHAIELFIDHFFNSEHFKNGIEIKILKDDDISLTYTLGRLAKLFKKYCNKKYIKASELDKYVKERNKITHRIFNEHDNITSINKNAKETVMLGNKILTDVRKFRNIILEKVINK